MRVLVVGANGLVGSRLVPALLTSGHEVTAVARGEARRTWKGVPFVSADLRDAKGLARAVTGASPDVIVNTAAMTDVDGCERAPFEAYEANVAGVGTLACLARERGAHLVHVSTDYVFDGEAGPYAPEAIPNPRGVYALTKHMGEQAVRTLCEGGRWTIARTAVVYGWPPAGQKNFGSWLVDSLAKGQAVKLFGDQWVSPSMALNVAEMLAELVTRQLDGIWHTCGAEVVDRVTFGHRLCEVFGFDASLVSPSRMSDVKLLSPRPARSGLDVTKTRSELAAAPWSLDASLKRFLAEYRGEDGGHT